MKGFSITHRLLPTGKTLHFPRTQRIFQAELEEGTYHLLFTDCAPESNSSAIGFHLDADA